MEKHHIWAEDSSFASFFVVNSQYISHYLEPYFTQLDPVVPGCIWFNPVEPGCTQLYLVIPVLLNLPILLDLGLEGTHGVNELPVPRGIFVLQLQLTKKM